MRFSSALTLSLVLHLLLLGSAVLLRGPAPTSISAQRGESYRLRWSATSGESSSATSANAASAGIRAARLSELLKTLEYPELARRMGVEGKLVLRLSIDAEGRVTSVQLEESSGSGMLDRAAISGARSWQFPLGPPEELRTAVRFRLSDPGN